MKYFNKSAFFIGRKIFIISLLFLLLALLSMPGTKVAHNFLSTNAEAYIDSAKKSEDVCYANYGSSAASMVTLESGSNRVLYQKNPHQKRPMASTTKILTAITVMENTENLNKIVSVPAKAVGIEGSSIYLKAGEKISILDLLYGLMLRSGNDSAVALAILTGGSVENFANLMNITAQKAGAKNSNFVNPHGLHHDNHYTTAYDLALITSYAMKNPVFKEISSSKQRMVSRENMDAETIFINKNKLLKSLEGADGVKTGFTKKAGRCLVASASRQGMQIITVVLNCGPMFEECSALIKRGFLEYKNTQILKNGEVLGSVNVHLGKNKRVSVGITEDYYYPLKSGEELVKEYKIPDFVSAPLTKGSVIGKVEIKRGDVVVFTSNVCLMEDAVPLDFADYVRIITSKW